jgi:hypothetical protein
MGAEIYELCGKGLRGAPVMCHLVATGAHDGRPATGSYQVRKARPSHRKQYKSWFKSWFGPEAWVSLHDAHPIVGQIYFPFDDRSLDGWSDRIVLDALVASCRFQLSKDDKVALTFVGHADPRGAARYNTTLGLRRAEAVQKYVDKGIRANIVERVRFFKYKSTSASLGETLATGDPAADRRVDIVLSSIEVKTVAPDPDPLFITLEYKGPLTQKLLFRSWGGTGLSAGPIGAEQAEIEIKNPRTGVRAFYYYLGGGVSPGLPISKSLPSGDYVEWEVPFALVDVDDFEGPGTITSAGAGAGGQCLHFLGPKLHRVKKRPGIHDGIAICSPGWGLQLGAGVSSGHWQRMPYRTEEDRKAYLKQFEPPRPAGP